MKRSAAAEAGIAIHRRSGRSGSTCPPALHYALALVGALMVAWFMVHVWRTPWRGASDFDQIYMAGMAWRSGIIPYGAHPPLLHIAGGPSSAIFDVYFYLPLCGILAAPLSLLPFHFAALLWRLVSFGLLLVSVWQFSRIVFPKWEGSIRLILLGFVATAGSVGWNLQQQQPTAIVVAQLLLFACAVIRERPRAAFVWGLLISLKPSYLVPVVGLLLLRGKGKITAALLAAIVALNLLAAAPTGIKATFGAYRQVMAHFEDEGRQNFPSALDYLTPFLVGNPNTPLAKYTPAGRGPAQWAGEQIHATFIFSSLMPPYNQLRAVKLARGAALLFTLGGVWYFVWIYRRKPDWRSDPLAQATAFAVLMAFGLLAVYHQRYDGVALLPLLLCSGAVYHRRAPGAAAAVAFCASLLLVWILRDAMLTRFWQPHVVIPHGLLPLAPVCGWITLTAFLAGSVMLSRLIARPKETS